MSGESAILVCDRTKDDSIFRTVKSFSSLKQDFLIAVNFNMSSIILNWRDLARSNSGDGNLESTIDDCFENETIDFLTPVGQSD